MEISTNAWDEITIVVLSKEPLTAMRIEQNIAAQLPEVEVQTESFESYEEAIDFCKKNQKVGFLFLDEREMDVDLSDIFQNLIAPYEKFGFPAGGVVLHGEEKTFNGLKFSCDSDQVLDYISVEEMKESKNIRSIMQDFWHKYTDMVSNRLMSKDIENLFRGMLSNSMSEESLHFKERTYQLLSGELNISWFSYVVVKNSFLITQVLNTNPNALNSNKHLESIMKNRLGEDQDDVDYMKKDGSLDKRIFKFVNDLDKKRKDDSLNEFLIDLKTNSKRRAPVIIKTAVRNLDSILSFAYGEDKALKVA